MKIKVMRRHIDKGICWDMKHCAVAEAVREALPDAHDVAVSGDEIRINGNYIRVPRSVERFINKFDKAKTTTQKRALRTFRFILNHK